MSNEIQFLLYNLPEDDDKVQVVIKDDTIWCTQRAMSQLFGGDTSGISRHLSNIFDSGELDEKSSLQKMQIANSDKPVTFYSLDTIIAIGYRVSSLRATRFRQWATRVLNEYIRKEYDERISEQEEANHKLEKHVHLLQETNLELVNRNMLMSQQLDIYYDVRRRIQMLKELVIRHQELMSKVDMRNDDELMALIETRLEQEHPFEDPNFGLAELADFIGTSKSRLIKLFRNLQLYRSADDYLDYMRLLRSMYYLQSQPSWGIAACAQEAGFAVVRTYNRKFLDILGMTPHEFRELLETGRKSEH